MSATAVQTDLYALVQHFYARQMQALAAGRFEDYVATFTEDGSFAHLPDAEPAVTEADTVDGGVDEIDVAGDSTADEGSADADTDENSEDE